MNLGSLVKSIAVDYKDKSPQGYLHVVNRANDALRYLETLGQYEFRKTSGIITTRADYTTGTIASVSNGGRTITFNGDATVADRWVGSHIRVASQNRWYFIMEATAGAGGTVTLLEPYEGDTIAEGSETFLVRRRFQPLPFLFESWYMGRQGQTPRIVTLAEARAWDDRILNSVGETGEPEVVIERGGSLVADYATGTLAMTPKSNTVTLSSGTFDQTRDLWSRLRIRGSEHDRELYAYTDTTHMSFRPAWELPTSPTGAEFEINPPGTQVVEVYPHPGVVRSISLEYFAVSPRLMELHEVPRFLPEAFHPLWEMETKLRLNMAVDKQAMSEMKGQLNAGASISRGMPRQLSAFGERGVQANNSPEGYVPDDMWGGKWVR